MDSNIKTIFVHNLGDFDGVYIYKYLLTLYNLKDVNSILDNDNKFITISLKTKDRSLLWLDSYRIFPVSLNDLCSVFNVEGKTSTYNPLFNKYSMFSNKSLLQLFKDYALQDSLALFKALLKAQSQYIDNYKIDITKALSTSNLSMKIFRASFLKHDIPIIKSFTDKFIREGYFGGSTDYYKAYGKNLKYYDVNSLYPFVMKNLMPHKVIKYHQNMTEISLNNVFGFFLAEVVSPTNLNNPILPYKSDTGETIYPHGKWKAIYFSEELKNAVKYGYKVRLLSGYEFSTIDLFGEYIDHFYNIKVNATGALRWISKLHLNTLYGVFGRKQELTKTININPKHLSAYAATHVIRNIIPITKDVVTLLVHSNLNHKTIDALNLDLQIDLNSKFFPVRSNVAIAAAVTAYARIHMSKFKNNPLFQLFYTDTDSIFIGSNLPVEMVGKELGLMKDELNGIVIQEAYFLGIKQYGYWFYNEEDNRIEKAVFAGVQYNFNINHINKREYCDFNNPINSDS